MRRTAAWQSQHACLSSTFFGRQTTVLSSFSWIEKKKLPTCHFHRILPRQSCEISVVAAAEASGLTE